MLAVEAIGLAKTYFAPVYAAMLATAVVVRSAALSGGAGLALVVAGIVAGNRTALGELFRRCGDRDPFSPGRAALPSWASPRCSSTPGWNAG